MNNKEIVCYLLGAIGDVTRDEAVKALKNFTELNEQELDNIIDDIIIDREKLIEILKTKYGIKVMSFDPSIYPGINAKYYSSDFVFNTSNIF